MKPLTKPFRVQQASVPIIPNLKKPQAVSTAAILKLSASEFLKTEKRFSAAGKPVRNWDRYE